VIVYRHPAPLPPLATSAQPHDPPEPPDSEPTGMTNNNSYFVPYVIERTGRGERSMDIYSRMLEERIVFIGTPIDDTVANSVMAQLLFLDKANRSQDIA